ncbi:MAG: flagellar filament capping protein FliD [Pelomonas sp.]|nr:flagellar filament capping protein FliD [Roseateles sp.]
MAISSPGIGSGLDVQSIVGQLVAIEQRPLATLQTQATTLNTQLSSLGTIKGKLAALQDAAAALSKPDFWTRTTGSSTGIAVNVSTSASATPAEYSVQVTQLAAAQSLASTGFTNSSSVVGTGKLRIETGSWANLGTPTAAFTPKSASLPFDIEIGTGQDTLAAIRAQINAAKAGVTASIVNDNTGSRLVIRSDTTGEENALRITQIDDSGTKVTGGALSALTYDPTGGAATSLTEMVAPKNALATLDGLNLVSSSNTFKDVADGMSFTAVDKTTAPLTIRVGIDTAAFKSALSKFTTAYNDLNTTIRDLTKYDEATKSGAVLQGDRTALSIQSQLRGLVQGTGGTSETYRRLSDLGIQMQRDGSLKTDDTKLTDALKNPAEVAKAMSSASDVTGASRGIGNLFQSFASVVTGTGGSLTSRTDSLGNRIKLNTKEQDRFNARIEDTRARLLKQYSALDTKLASLNGLNTYMTQQITNWNKSTG